MQTQYDIVIAGGGMVGATLALLLLRQGVVRPARLCVLEKADAVQWSADDTPDLRVVALSRASERILRAAGVWSQIAAARVSPYEHMQVWHAKDAPRSDAVLRFDAAQLAEGNLGHIVENRLIQASLQSQLATAGVAFHHQSLDGVTFDASAVQVQAGGQTLSARLLVGADGARSAVRRHAGLWVDSEDYAQSGIVANVACERPHERTAWQRFLGDGTLALLPLASGECSIVWSVPTARAQALLGLAGADFERELTAASDGVLGALQLRSERLSFPLRRSGARQYVLERCVLVGDAAHVVHPLAGQGVNLGLLDAAALAQVLKAGQAEQEDIGALRLLRRYERWRKTENELMSVAFDGFNRLLSTGNDAIARLAQRGLGQINRSDALRRLLTERALGVVGDLPDVALA